MQKLKIGIPKGSLENATIELFKKSGWKITTSSRSYFPSIDDDELTCVAGARPGNAALCGKRQLLMSPSPARTGYLRTTLIVEVVCDLIYSKTTSTACPVGAGGER